MSVSPTGDPAADYARQAPPLLKQAAVAQAIEIKVFKQAVSDNERLALSLIESTAQAAPLRNAVEGVGQGLDVYA